MQHRNNTYRFFVPFILCITACQASGTDKPVTAEQAKAGEALFTTDACITCHSFRGEKKYGPSLNDILDKEIEVVEKGEVKTVTVDRRYLERSVADPDFQKVKGYERKKMIRPDIPPADIQKLVDYIIYMNRNGSLP